MKLLKEFITEIVSASDSYLEKEMTRESLQKIILDMILKNKIKNQAELDDFFKTSDMAFKSLKMIPFNVYEKLSNK